MEIKVLGPGCANCKRLEALVRETVGVLGLKCEVAKVTDFKEIAAYGILATPGLVIDAEVKSVGRIPSKVEVAGWLTEAGAR